MKKALSLILAVMMLLGCMSITAFADGKTMITEVNLTVGKTYTDLDTGVSVSVPGEADYTASYGGMEFVVGSDVYFYQITGGDSNLWLNMKSYTPCQTPPDVSNADKVFAVINLYTKDWQTYAFAENAGLTVTCNGRTINQKAQAASEEGWFSVGGISYQVLIDITPFKTSGNTDITLTVAKALTYDMVIPEDVTNLNAAGVFEVGQAKATNVKNATDKTVISYTAATTAFKCEGKTDIPASYYTDEAGQNDFPTTAVEVYKNKADAASIPTMYVGISESDWNAAENGTYTATVTYNFSAEEKEAKTVTAADALTTGTMYKLELVYNSKQNLSFTYMKTTDGFELKEILEDGEDVTVESADACSSTVDGANINFTLGQMTFILNTSTNTYSLSEKAEFTRFSVKPAGATEFTEVTLTPAQ